MAEFLCSLVALGACVIGKICGMGGGVIIKPALDAFGLFPVATINFLSGCTVLGMSGFSVLKSAASHHSEINWKISTPIAVGAAAGGIIGKECFRAVASAFPSAETAGGVQAAVLFFATLATLLYTLKKAKIRGKTITSLLPCFIIGLCLGTLGSFLGIGGGPFNMAAFYFFFSMSTKTAAQNSLYVILISQLTGLLRTAVTGSVPEVMPALLCFMIFSGILGSEIGSLINRRLSEQSVTKLFEASMAGVMLINIFNAVTLLAPTA